MITSLHLRSFPSSLRCPLDRSRWQRFFCLSPVLLVLAVFCLFQTPRLQAAVLYAEDFETITSGWTIGSTTPGTISFADGAQEGAPFPTRSLLLSHPAGNATRLTSTMPSNEYEIGKTSPESYRFEFDLRLSRADTAGYIVFYDAAFSSQLPMFIQITSGGAFVVGYWDGEKNVNHTLLSGYEAETTYRFTFTTTPSTGLFSADVSGGSNPMIDGGFRRTLAGATPFQNFNRMQIYNDGGSGNGIPYDIYIDNVRIEQIPEPATGAFLWLTGGCGAAMLLRRKRPNALRDS